jgi:hypothetical protein
MSKAIFFLFANVFSGATAAGYEIAPITTDMQDATDAIVASLLPTTQLSSVGWQRLAYITGIYFTNSELRYLFLYIPWFTYLPFHINKEFCKHPIREYFCI